MIVKSHSWSCSVEIVRINEEGMWKAMLYSRYHTTSKSEHSSNLTKLEPKIALVFNCVIFTWEVELFFSKTEVL